MLDLFRIKGFQYVEYLITIYSYASLSFSLISFFKDNCKITIISIKDIYVSLFQKADLIGTSSMIKYFQKKGCVSLGGVMSKTSLLLPFTIDHKKESSVPKPVTHPTQRSITKSLSTITPHIIKRRKDTYPFISEIKVNKSK